MERIRTFTRRHPEMVATIPPPGRPGHADRRMLALFHDEKLRSVLRYMLDEREFLGPYGIRALSRHHLDHPYVFTVNGEVHRVDYQPAESTSGLFGGNSNWRGPVWMPVNAILVRALLHLYAFYGDEFTVECPTGSGKPHDALRGRARDRRAPHSDLPARPLGGRAVYGDAAKFQTDPHWRDLILFYEYFHGDNGAGLDASHQTGWTGLVAVLIQFFGSVDAERLLVGGLTTVVGYSGARDTW
jgi:hypothetical protein